MPKLIILSIRKAPLRKPVYLKEIIFDKSRTMKNSTLLILAIVCIYSCKQTTKNIVATETEQISILQKIANAHGYENWTGVNDIGFTFNVDRDTSHFERAWHWKIAEHRVTSISEEDTISYSRTAIDSTLFKVDSGFINDKYWLLAPFNLVWDQENFSFSEQPDTIAPISKETMHKLTIIYGNEGGYTPGDAYDFYFGDDYIIREWVFRKSNQPEPSLITSWEDYENIGGLELSTSHIKEGGSWRLYFTDLEVH